MNMKSVAALTPICMLFVAGTARADLEPFSFGASETVEHQSNIYRDDVHKQSDWLSTTELRAALDEALGRERLLVAGSVDLNRYKHAKPRNSTGYDASAELDLSTVGDLSGAVGADSHRTQYVPGQTEVFDQTTGGISTIEESNLQTTNHVFARASLGGASRWQLFTGVDANRRTYSSSTYHGNDERQWSVNAGTNYSTSPDLSFGVSGGYTNGEYPHPALGAEAQKFSVRSVSANTKWRASGNSAFDAAVGVTSQDSEALSKNQHFVHGSVNWNWTPPSHFSLTLGLKRSSDADTGTTGLNTGIVNANNLNGASINNIALLNVNYELSAKVSLTAAAQYTQRKYADLLYTNPVTEITTDVNGSTRTTRLFLSAHYQPTRTTDVSCGGGREIRRIDSALNNVTPAYSNNIAHCTASINFQ